MQHKDSIHAGEPDPVPSPSRATIYSGSSASAVASSSELTAMLWDYIVVGGGLSGSVVSNRLLEYNNALKILVIEAGPNADSDPGLVWANATNTIGGTYDWKLASVPQAHVNNRSVTLAQGKALGGGTAINMGKSRMSADHTQKR